MGDFVVKGGKALRLGYTTGSCATAAATAAALMLLTGEKTDEITITLPDGGRVTFAVKDAQLSAQRASCAVIKDAGDDPDVTDGMRLVATCERLESGLKIHGGEGVGRVVSDGLSIARGEAAINPAPRKMMTGNLRELCERHGYSGGLKVIISAPGGEEIAKKTFNPRLGIVGGISILGTTGIVEPMSERAIVETIKLLIDKRKLADPDTILIAPGNYGLAFCREHLGLGAVPVVKYANFLGECLDYLVYKDFRRALLVGHVGKLVKVAGGIMNTHSSVADCRMEIFAAHAACVGAEAQIVRAIMAAATTDEAVNILTGAGCAATTFQSVLEKLLFHLDYRVKGKLEMGVVAFGGNAILMRSDNAAAMAALLAEGGV